MRHSFVSLQVADTQNALAKQPLNRASDLKRSLRALSRVGETEATQRDTADHAFAEAGEKAVAMTAA
jgi:hypothetical protein